MPCGSSLQRQKIMLEGMNYLFIYRDRTSGRIEFFETVFLPRNYQHLTGIEYLGSDGKPRKNSVFFYRKCLNNTITEDEIRFRNDGTRPKLAVERIAGTTNYCLGFVRDSNYYVPGSCLLEDIQKLGDRPSQILAVLSKKADRSEPVYKTVRYTAKGVDLDRLKLTDSLNRLVSLDNHAGME